MRVILILVIAFAPALAAAGPDVLRAPLAASQAGVFCPYETGETIPAPETQLGYIHRGPADPVRVSDGTLVPARLGMAFGIELRTQPGTQLQGVTVIVTRPAAGTAPALTDRWRTTIGPTGGASRFKFEFPDEIVLGTWSFAIEAGGDILFRQEFDVVPDWMLPDIVNACFGADMLS